MSNMIDYIKWRGDLPIDKIPVGEVDALILAQFSMMRWEGALNEGESETLNALFPALNHPPVSVGFTAEDDAIMLELAAHSERFGALTVSDFVSVFDAERVEQFAAITLHLPDESIYVSFRGTDSTLVGWREDSRLAFSKPIPAQGEAAAYLKRVCEKYPGAVRVGGHSKGGNLAMYAAAALDDAMRERVLAIYNFDGPGFGDPANASMLYERLHGRLHTRIPQGSIVGLLLAHPDEYEVVRSIGKGFLQHDPYTWQVAGSRFVRMPEISRESARLDIAFHNWLTAMDESDRELLVGTLFDILQSTQARAFGDDFWQSLARNPGAVMTAINDVEPGTRLRLFRMLVELVNSMVSAGSEPRLGSGDTV